MEERAEKQKVLIVDDAPENIHVLMETLKDTYTIIAAVRGDKALKLAEADPLPDIILLDVMMPDMDGYEVCTRLKSNEKTHDIPVVFITALTAENNEYRGLELGAVDYITKPFSPDLVRARIRNHLELKWHRDHLEKLVKERTRELELTQEATIESMGTLAEFRDPETGGHIKRTQHYLSALAEQLKNHPRFREFFQEKTEHLLYISAPLHDIGKVAIPDSILMKPGKLTEEEFEIMKKHTLYGRDAIRATSGKLGKRETFLHIAEEIAHTHHEKWDGTGYPQGLKGEAIPISGRLMALADVYDALISKRVYKPPFSHEKAFSIILEGSGTHFDPDVVDAFRHIESSFRQIAFKFADFEEERKNLMPSTPDEPVESLLQEKTANEVRSHTFTEKLPGIDIEGGFRRVGGNRTLFYNLLEDFYRDYKDTTAMIKEALRNEDSKLAERTAHTIRGLAGNLSADELMSAAAILEENIKKGHFESIDDMLNAFDNELMVVMHSIDKMMNLKSSERGIHGERSQ